MPRKPLPECILLLQDVGKNMSEITSDNDECLKISRDCCMNILLRRLFTKSPDEIALITFGGEKTNNKLANKDEYRGIDVKTEHFSIVNAEILREVDTLKVNPNDVGDWLDAIVVAIQFMCDESEMKSFSARKIVLFSNFHNNVNDNQVDLITKKLKEMKIEMTVIGPDVPAHVSSGGVGSKSARGETIISDMVDKLDGTLCSFKDAFKELENLTKKATKPSPWNAMFHISSRIKIPIRAFKKIAEPKAFKWTLGAIDEPNAAVYKDTAYMKFDESSETEVAIEREELIDAYLFGTTIVPFSDIDKESMTYKSGPKGLFLIGCAKKETVPQSILMGDGTYIVLAKQDDDVADHMLQALIQAMYENNFVGIARRVYNNGSAAYIGALYPYVTEESRYLVYAQLPFAEDEHVYRFPSLNKTQVTDEQMQAVDNLIDAMDLDQFDGDEEMYDITNTYDPHEQYSLRCLGHKFMYPKEDIPEEIMNDIIRAMQPKPVVVENSKSALLEVKEKFPLQKVIKRTKGGFSKDGDMDQVSDLQIGGGTLFPKPGVSSDPGSSSSSEYRSMQLAVEDALSTKPEKIDDFLNKLKALRQKCSLKNPEIYNDWIPRIKETIEKENLSKFWDAIVNEKLGYISQSESALSDINDKMVEEFLKSAKVNSKNDEADSLYGSIDTESNNDNWLDDL